MTLGLAFLFTADGRQAKAEIASMKKETDAAKASAQGLGREGRRASGGVDAMGDAARNSAGDMDALATSGRRAATEARGTAEGHRLAAGSVGNLTAQFNDLGVMLAAGQNPLQLALQQGTQITQVIGPMGASGAVRSLGTAFMSMLSPINLITIGGIAAGAALTQWLLSGTQDAETLEEALEGLEESVDSYAARLKEANADLGELQERYGNSSFARQVLGDIAEVEARIARLDFGDAIRRFSEDQDVTLPNWDFGDQQRMAEQFDLSLFGRGRRERQAFINAVLEDFADLEKAADSTIEAQIDALEDLFDSYEAAARASGDITDEENARLQTIGQMIVKLMELKALEDRRAEGAAAGAISPEQVAAYERYYASRISGEEYLARARAEEQAKLGEIYSIYVQSREASDQQHRAAQDILADLQQEERLQAAILQYGQESQQVADLRAAAERQALEEQMDADGVAGSLRDKILETYNNSKAIADLNLAAGISPAAAEAERLAGWLDVSFQTATKLAALGPQGMPQPGADGYSGRGGDPRQYGGGFYDWKNREGTEFLDNWTPPKTPRGGGAGGRAARKEEREREAVERLIGRMQEQLDISRETDEVQKEMIRNRETLAAATDAERAEVERLIAARIAEEDAVAQATQAQEFFKNTAYDTLEYLAFEAESAADAWDKLKDAIMRAAFQALVAGEGPLAGLFGTSGDGGILGMIGSFFAPKNAEGGPIERPGSGMLYGAGTGTSDDVLMYGSSGEFIVNARATARNRHLLEAINSGTPAFAGGGMIGGAPAASPAPAAAGPQGGLLQIEVLPSELFEVRTRQTAQDVSQQMIGDYDSAVLPLSVRRIQDDPGSIGK